MKRILLFLALLVAPVAYGQTTCDTFPPADVFFNFNGATPGTAVSTTNLASSTEGTYSSWASASADQAYAASQVALPAAVSVVGGSTHACGFATQAVGQNTNSTFNFSQINFSGTHTVVVISGWLSNLPPSQGGSGQLMDLTDVLSSGTHNAVLQLVHGTGNNCAAYGIEIEAPQNGTAHSNCNQSVAPGGTYFYSMIINWTTTGNCGIGQGGSVVVAPCAGAFFYTNSGNVFTQVGPSVAVSLAVSGDHLTQMFFGQDEDATCTGTTAACTLYFQNTMIDWTNPVWPNIPEAWSNVLYPDTALNTPCNFINQATPGQCAWPYWQNAGVPGGIPSGSWTQSGSTISSGASESTIQTALNSCAGSSLPGKYVLLGAGTFTISSSLTVPSYCVLRGSGANSTILNATLASGNVINLGSGAPNVSDRVSITGGTNAGSNVITVSSATNFSVGKLVSISQLQDGVIVTNVGSEGTCTWCDGFENDSGLRAQGQTDLITGVSGTSITLAEPLMVNYILTPDATPYSPGGTYSGIENLQVYANGTRSVGTTNGNFYMTDCLYCWVSGFEGNYADGDHGFTDYSYHGEIVNSYFSNNYYHDAGQNDDSVTLRLKTTGFLIQNNIFERLMSTVETEWGASGNVIAYNYSFSGFLYGSANFLQADMNTHGSHEMFNLFEGNVVESLGQDSIWGSAANNTYFRNWMPGVSYLCPPVAEGRNTVTCGSPYYTNQADRAFDANALNSNTNVIANVEGSTGQSSIGSGVALAVAVCGPSPCGAGSRIYQGTWYNETYGYGTSSDTGSQAIDSIIPYDTTFLHGEYGTKNNSIYYNGSYSQTFPQSYYLPAKPSWWSAAVAWPAIGPDITGASGPGGHVALTAGNAAQYCYTAVMGGADGGANSPFTFNPTNCYSGGGGGTVSFAPTALNFGNVPTGTLGTTQVATLSNTSGVTITFSSLGQTGSYSDFPYTTTCASFSGGTLTSGNSCTISVTFTPTGTPGFAETATFTLNYTGAAGSPLIANLTGTSAGVAAVAQVHIDTGGVRIR